MKPSNNMQHYANGTQPDACTPTPDEMAKARSQRSLADWIVASRPWSFPASLIPVIATTAWLLWQSKVQMWTGCDWTCALLALLMLVLMQAAGNLTGDYYDHRRGIDLPGSLNGVRHIQSGKFMPHEILRYGYVCLAIASLLGIAILSRCGWQAAWLGVLGILLVMCYPWLKAHALGDVDILLSYALLPALGVGFAVTGRWMWQPVLLSVPAGLITVSILHANNTRDILNDSRAGINTLCIMAGGRMSQWIYLAENLMAYLLLPVFALAGLLPWACLAAWLTLPMAYSNVSRMMKAEPLADEPIATLDQHTAQLQMFFGLLYALAFVVTTFI